MKYIKKFNESLDMTKESFEVTSDEFNSTEISWLQIKLK